MCSYYVQNAERYSFFFLLYFILLFCVFFFNWGAVDLQCCVSFRCTAVWFRYIHIYIFQIYTYFRLYSIIGYYKILNVLPCIIQWILVAYLKQNKTKTNNKQKTKKQNAGHMDSDGPKMCLRMHKTPYSSAVKFHPPAKLPIGHPRIRRCF